MSINTFLSDNQTFTMSGFYNRENAKVFLSVASELPVGNANEVVFISNSGILAINDGSVWKTIQLAEPYSETFPLNSSLSGVLEIWVESASGNFTVVTGSGINTATNLSLKSSTFTSSSVYFESGVGGGNIHSFYFDGAASHFISNVAGVFSGTDKPCTVIALVRPTEVFSSATSATIYGLGRSTVDTPFHTVGANGGGFPTNNIFMNRRGNSNDIVNMGTSGTFQTNAWQIVSYVFTGTTASVYASGLPVAVGSGMNVSDLTLNQSAVGALKRTTTSNYWKGYISEVFVYSSGLNDTERSQIEGYLANKHGLTITQ